MSASRAVPAPSQRKAFRPLVCDFTRREVGLAWAFETQTLSVSGPERGRRRSRAAASPLPHVTSGMLSVLLGGWSSSSRDGGSRPGWGSVLRPPPTVVSATLEVLTVQGPSPSRLPRPRSCGLWPGNALGWGPSGTEPGQEASPDAGVAQACASARLQHGWGARRV